MMITRISSTTSGSSRLKGIRLIMISSRLHRHNNYLQKSCRQHRSSSRRCRCCHPISSSSTRTEAVSSASSSSAAAALLAESNTTTKRLFHLDDTNGLLYDITNTQDQNNNEPIYQVIIGLEVHAQLDIPTKLFSSAPYPSSSSSSSSSSASSIPNTNVHPYDVAVPGYLPLLSGSAVRAAIIAASALDCVDIPPVSRFERKHYAYADLPHGYQITQQRWPIARNGKIIFSTTTTETGKKKKKTNNDSSLTTTSSCCRIERIQLEQDTAKTTIANENTDSRVDFDRAGCALIEIVTAPDLRSPQQAMSLVKHIRNLLQHLGLCKGRMQDGHLRVDANINLQRMQQQQQQQQQHENNENRNEEPSSSNNNKWRTPRVEVKNLNSIQQVAAATTYEALRQASVFDIDTMDADAIKRFPEETRTWNAATSSTSLIRKKDQEDDYRFLPEPDLPPLVLQDFISQYGYTSLDEFLKANVPERPEVVVLRLQERYGYSDSQASVLAQHNDPSAIRLLEDVLLKLLVVSEDGEEAGQSKQQQKQYAKLAYNLLVNELFALVKECAGDDQEPSLSEQNTVTADQLSVLVQMLVEGSISKTQSKKLLQLLFREYVGEDPRWVASECNLTLISDPVQLQKVCRRVLEENPNELIKYQRGGKFATKMRKFFTGQAMTITNYNAHPERLQEALAEVLEEIEDDSS